METTALTITGMTCASCVTRVEKALVRVEAVGVNFIDVYHRTGLYPVPLPFVPGGEVAGVVCTSDADCPTGEVCRGGQCAPPVAGDAGAADGGLLQQILRHIEVWCLPTQIPAKLVADGEADALVSAGNTGAGVLACARHFKLIPGVRRAALAAVYPTRLRHGEKEDPFSLILDVGATVDATAEDLVAFAVMGAAYARVISRNPFSTMRSMVDLTVA